VSPYRKDECGAGKVRRDRYNDLVMWMILGDKTSSIVVPWLMMALVALLIGGLLFAWLLGRLLGPRSNWGKPLTGGDRRADDAGSVDVWAESGRRVRTERDENDTAS